MKFPEQRILLVRIHLVNRQKKRLPRAIQQPRQLSIGRRNLGASIDYHNNGRRFFERHPRLPKNLRRDEIFVVRNDSALIDPAKFMPQPLHFPVESVTRDAGIIANDSAPRPSKMIEESRFAAVRSSDDGDQRSRFFYTKAFVTSESVWFDCIYEGNCPKQTSHPGASSPEARSAQPVAHYRY